MINIHEHTLQSFHQGLINKKFKALEFLQATLEHIRRHDNKVSAFLSLNEDEAYQQAEEADLKIARGEKIQLLTGAPMAIKDNILIKGLKATAASKILENYTASYDATVITKLRNAGAIFVGKTNMDEFAMGSSTENSAFKLTRNPHDPKKVPGGSSGGSAAAVSSCMCLGALGTDTGGSIRQPASFCGVVGLKPTYGSVSRFGAIAMASSLDQIGPITRTVADNAALFYSISGQDAYDSTSAPTLFDWQKLTEPKLTDIQKLKIGLPKEYFLHSTDDETAAAVEETIKRLRSLKIEFKNVSLPHTSYALATYYIIMPAEVSANLARYDGMRYDRSADALEESSDLLDFYRKERGLGFGTEAKRRIILGAFVLSSGYYDAYYSKAQKVRKLIEEDFNNAFREVDVLLTPVSPTPAFNIGEKTSDPLEMYLSDIFTSTANLAGVPAISIPTYSPTSLPVGFQLIGKHFHEADILGIGQYYEKIRENKNI